MDRNKKTFIKNTLLGLISGGAIASLYAMNQRKRDEDDVKKTTNEIIVPLSRRNYLKSIRSDEKSEDNESSSNPVELKDIDTMAPKDLAALKRSLLRKKASSGKAGDASFPVNIKDTVSPETLDSGVTKSKGNTYISLRDRNGRYSSNSLLKDAGILDDSSNLVNSTVGLVGGTALGMVLMKKLTDRVYKNKKERELEQSRRRYANMLTREINDEDAPYYSKAAEDRSTLGSALGLIRLAGLTSAGLAGVITYKIMENRRKAEESAADKDINKYPADKTVKFKFANDRSKSFFA